jgi:1,4-alpha-glucan branching enzyme
MTIFKPKTLPLRPERQNAKRKIINKMSLKKQFSKSKPVCKVTFTVEPEVINGGKEVAILGEFNNWDPSEDTMKKLKDGSFSKTIELEIGHEYQFRYLVDGERWINDTEADKYLQSSVASEKNGVVAL